MYALFSQLIKVNFFYFSMEDLELFAQVFTAYSSYQSVIWVTNQLVSKNVDIYK